MADSNENETTESTPVVEPTPAVKEGPIHSGDPEAVPHIGKDAVHQLLDKFSHPQTEFMPEHLDLSKECPKGLVANMKTQYQADGSKNE